MSTTDAPRQPSLANIANLLALLAKEERPVLSCWIPAEGWPRIRNILRAEGCDFIAILVGQKHCWERLIVWAGTRIRELHAQRLQIEEAEPMLTIWLRLRRFTEVDASPAWRDALAARDAATDGHAREGERTEGKNLALASLQE